MKKQRIPRKLKKKISRMGIVHAIKTLSKTTPKMYEGKIGDKFLLDEMALWQH